MQRRTFIKSLSALAYAAVLLPLKTMAAVWNKGAFEATSVNAAKQDLHINTAKNSADIIIIAPEKAENGAVVQVEVVSNIPNTEAIAIFVEKNPVPLIANFMFSNGAEPSVITRIKMAETSDVEAVIKVGEHYFSARKNVIVLENGCG